MTSTSVILEATRISLTHEFVTRVLNQASYEPKPDCIQAFGSKVWQTSSKRMAPNIAEVSRLNLLYKIPL